MDRRENVAHVSGSPADDDLIRRDDAPQWIEDGEVVEWLHGIYFANCHFRRTLNCVTEIELENAAPGYAQAEFHSILANIRSWHADRGVVPLYWYAGDASEAPLYRVTIHQAIPDEMHQDYGHMIARLAAARENALVATKAELDRRDAITRGLEWPSLTSLDRARLVPMHLHSSCHASELAAQWAQVRQMLRGRSIPMALLAPSETAEVATELGIPPHHAPERLVAWCCGVSDQIGPELRRRMGFRPQAWDGRRPRETVFPETPYAELERAHDPVQVKPSIDHSRAPGQRPRLASGASGSVEARKVVPQRISLERDFPFPRLTAEIEPSHERLRWRPDDIRESEKGHGIPAKGRKRKQATKEIGNTTKAIGFTATTAPNISPAEYPVQWDGAVSALFGDHFSGASHLRKETSGDGHMSVRSYVRLRAAAEFAASMGWPLGAKVTITPINWGIRRPEDCRKVLADYLKRLATWFGDKGSAPFAWVYVWEKGVQNGYHVHLAIHVPDHLTRPFQEWNRKFGKTADKISGRLAPVGEPAVAFYPRKDLFGQAEWLAYMGKHLDPKPVFTFGSGKYTASQAQLFGADEYYRGPCALPAALGKRVGVSQSLGPKAQTGFDFRPMIARLLQALEKRAGL